MMRKTYTKAINLINRCINRKKITRKVFCIGLHKTGTTSLRALATKYGYKAIHSTDWISDANKLKEFEFFSDGGSHFDGQNEFDFKRLFHDYPNALFILQTRPTKNWIVSKLKHAGWTEQTIIEVDDEKKIYHDDWKYKSLLIIESFIRHKYNYEHKVIDFFEKNDPSRLLKIDITDKPIQETTIHNLVTFLGLRSLCTIQLPHKNKKKSQDGLSKEVSDFIYKTMNDCASDKK
ncbi:sulfotransferase [Desulfoplanes sp. PS50]